MDNIAVAAAGCRYTAARGILLPRCVVKVPGHRYKLNPPQLRPVTVVIHKIRREPERVIGLRGCGTLYGPQGPTTFAIAYINFS